MDCHRQDGLFRRAVQTRCDPFRQDELLRSTIRTLSTYLDGLFRRTAQARWTRSDGPFKRPAHVSRLTCPPHVIIPDMIISPRIRPRTDRDRWHASALDPGSFRSRHGFATRSTLVSGFWERSSGFNPPQYPPPSAINQPPHPRFSKTVLVSCVVTAATPRARTCEPLRRRCSPMATFQPSASDNTNTKRRPSWSRIVARSRCRPL